MFQLVKYIKRNDNYSKYIYKLIDSDFETEFEYDTTAKGTIQYEIAVASEYEKRNLNIAANLALFYKRAVDFSGYDSIKL